MAFNKNVKKEGVELSRNSADSAKKRGIKIYNDFVENINFNKKYDIVSAFAILEHLSDPLILLDKIRNIIAEGGILAILIPSYESLKERVMTKLNHNWSMYSPPIHLNFFSRKFLDAYLSHLGFTMIKRYHKTGITRRSKYFGKGYPFLRQLSLQR